MSKSALHSFDLSPFEAPTTSVHIRLVRRHTSRGDIVGNTTPIIEALRVIDRVAASNCTVLVTGESGTGKESMVAALHDASPRKTAPLVSVNCGAIPAELAEAELFGHSRGAFTGAHGSRKGYVAAAEGGTLFLDEVGELPPAVQVKLLRVLQQREYVPVGESRAVACDVRIVAATNRDLEKEVRAGRFREDLYFRLNVIHVQLAPLRERVADIQVLANYFFERARRVAERWPLKGFTDDCKRAMDAFHWPGNIRALENCIERAVWITDGPWITERDLFSPNVLSDTAAAAAAVRRTTPPASFENVRPGPGPARASMAPGGPRPSGFPSMLPETGIDVVEAAERYQNYLIIQALKRTAGNKNRAAQLLGLNRTTLSEMIRRRGLQL
jgi:sigma-54 specific flagellar transcriptional regulator A